jgi:hypothetical protein
MNGVRVRTVLSDCPGCQAAGELTGSLAGWQTESDTAVVKGYQK